MTDRYNNMKYSEETVPCSSEEMEEAVQGHFIFSTAIIGPDNAEIVGNLHRPAVGRWLSRTDGQFGEMCDEPQQHMWNLF